MYRICAIVSGLLPVFGCAQIEDPTTWDVAADTSIADTSTEVFDSTPADLTDTVVPDIVDTWDAPDTSVPPDVTDTWDAPDTSVPPDVTDTWDAPVDTLDTSDPPDDSTVEPELCGGVICAAGEECCTGTCTDTQNDIYNCGACYNFCDWTKSDRCTAGSCMCMTSPECSSGIWWSCCTPDGCVDTESDDDHCGACGIECWFGEWCDWGWCESP